MTTDGKPTGAENPAGDTSPASDSTDAATQERINAVVKKVKADMERTFAKRSETIKQEALQGFLDTLGIDAEDLQSAQEKIKGVMGAGDEAKQTKRALEKALAEKSKLEADLGKIETERRESALKAEVLRIASDKAIDPANVYFALKGRGSIGWHDGKMAIFDDNGEVDQTQTLEKHITKFIGDHASFQKVTSPSGGGSRTGANGSAKKPALTTREGRYQDFLESQNKR